MTETDAPGAKDAATISRFSASGQRLRRPDAVVPITGFVDTSRPPNPEDHITLKMKFSDPGRRLSAEANAVFRSLALALGAYNVRLKPVMRAKPASD
jgi:hypothetical protein